MKPARTHLLSFRGWFAVVFLDNIHMDIAANMSVCLHSSAKWNIITLFLGLDRHIWIGNSISQHVPSWLSAAGCSPPFASFAGWEARTYQKTNKRLKICKRTRKGVHLFWTFWTCALWMRTFAREQNCNKALASCCLRVVFVECGFTMFYFSVQTIESGMLKKVDGLCCFDLFRALRQDRGTQNVRITATCDSR